MEPAIRIFLKKLLASIYLMGIHLIPFSGESFQDGISNMEEYLNNHLDEDCFEMISDIFIKTPVEESYNQIRDMIMTLNGDEIGFSSVDNPYWRNLSIKINDYYARNIIQDAEIIDIDEDVIKNAAIAFCEAAGVDVWVRY